MCFAQLPLQDGAVSFSDVINLDSTYTATNIYSSAKEFVLTNTKAFNRSNSENHGSGKDAIWGLSKNKGESVDLLYKNENPLKLDDPGKRITAKGVFKYTGRDALAPVLRLMYVEYNVNIYIKDGRYKIDITDFNYTHYNNREMKQMQIGTWKDEGPCSSKGKIETLLICDKAKKDFDIFYPALSDEMDKFHKELVSFIGKKRDKKEDF